MERAKSGAEVRERARETCWLLDGVGGKSWGSRTPRKCLGFSLGQLGRPSHRLLKLGKEDGLWFASSVLPAFA